MGSHFGAAGAFLVQTIFGIALLIVMLRFLLQLVKADFYNPASQLIVRATQPILAPMRRIIPGVGGIDLSSIVLMLVLQMVETGLLKAMGAYALFNVSTAGLLVWAIADLVELATFVFIFSLIVQVILSWLSPGAYNPVVGLLYSFNEPILRPARRVLPSTSGLDFSPLIALIFLNLIQILVVGILRDVAISI